MKENTPTDTQLDELFAAKRTQQANQRRQEALRAAIAAEAGDMRKRRLWPIWTGAAAAVALLAVATPLLHGPAESRMASVPTLPEPAYEPEPVPLDDATARPIDFATAHPIADSPVAPQRGSHRRPSPVGTTATTATPAPAAPYSTPEGPADATPSVPTQPAATPAATAPAATVPAAPEPMATPAARVHRRTSSRMVATDTKRERQAESNAKLLAVFTDHDTVSATQLLAFNIK